MGRCTVFSWGLAGPLLKNRHRPLLGSNIHARCHELMIVSNPCPIVLGQSYIQRLALLYDLGSPDLNHIIIVYYFRKMSNS